MFDIRDQRRQEGRDMQDESGKNVERLPSIEIRLRGAYVAPT